MPEKLLILGGTREAYELAERLVSQFSPEQLTVISSLAGVTEHPRQPAGEVRIGGFSDTTGTGGKSGLQNYLLQEKISLLVNATHPYAAQISENALAAATELQIPFLRMTRPPWVKQPGDQWIEVPDLAAAAEYLKSEFEISNSDLSRATVFLTTGNRGLEHFEQCKRCNFVVRTVDVPKLDKSSSVIPTWSDATFLQERGPFTLENELNLFRQHAITLLVTKNSGGNSTSAKIEAARKMEIPVLIVERPQLKPSEVCSTVVEVMNFVLRHSTL
jgi:precorrin-6A/cobalt-precorrin-6A reductase